MLLKRITERVAAFNIPVLLFSMVYITMGYTGQLAGPAFVGYVAYRFSIETAFGLIAFLMLLVAMLYHFRKVK